MPRFPAHAVVRYALLASAVLLAPAALLPAQQPDGRAPVPDEAAIRKVLELVREVYAEEYEGAKTPAQRTALARKLVARAAEATSDPVSRYALLYVGRNLATAAGDAPTAMLVVERIAAGFQVDGLAMKAETLAKLTDKARSTSQKKALATAAAGLIDEAVTAERYEIAARAAEAAIGAARSSRDGKLIKTSVARKREVEAAAKSHAAAQEALAVLEKQPGDPAANLAAGRYYCFVKGDWEKGIPMLALGSETALKELAERELRGPASPADRAGVGDGWWKLAEKEDGRAGEAMLLRAGAWYKQAQPHVGSVLLKTKLAKRLEEVAKIGRPTPETQGAAEQHLPLRSVAKMFGLSDPEWSTETDCLKGIVGYSMRGGQADCQEFLSTRPLSTSSCTFGFKTKSKWYHQILLFIDSRRYFFSQGHWSNTGSFLICDHKETRSKGTVSSPDEWCSLAASLKDDTLSFYYKEKLMWKGKVPEVPGGKHEVRVGFGSYKTTVRVKDFYLQHD